MCLKESPTIFMDRQASRSSKKIHSEKVVISGHRCQYLFRSSIQEEKRSTASEEDRYVSTAKEQEILVELNINVMPVVAQEK